MARCRVAIVVPAYNEELTVARQITSLSQFGDVIVVDDGSNDATYEMCKRSNCRLISFPENRGYDMALQAGITAALDYEYVITTDADGEIPIASVENVITKLLSGNDCVLGVRSIFPRFAEHMVNKIVYYKYGIQDIFCGLKGYRVDKIRPDFKFKNSIGTSLALDFLERKANVATVYVTTENRSDASRFGKNDLKTNFKLLRVINHVI